MKSATENRSLKRDRIIYWIFTSLIVILESVIPALTFNSEMAKEGISHLGFPDYFRIELTVGKILGGILLILPMIPARLKEWAYVGFGITFISAMTGHLVIDGISEAMIPFIGLVLLTVSYIFYHRIKNQSLSTTGTMGKADLSDSKDFSRPKPQSSTV
ncbi:MAG: DoxX family protein [Chitinophagales bacterium]